MTQMSARFSFRVAFRNAFHTLWSGVVVVALYLLVVGVGPAVEAKMFPVITGYHLAQPRHTSTGGITFYPEFEKTRDCTYYGINWFAPDERGNLIRIQSRRAEGPQVAPETGPVGQRRGERQYILPPAGTEQFYGIMHHQCGPLWQTRTQVGPFSMKDGRLVRPR